MYKAKADEMKKIALLDVGRLEDKILPFVKTLDDTQSIESEILLRPSSRALHQEI